MYYDQIKLLKQGVEKARGLLGDAIDVVPGLGTVNQGLLAAENIGRGNLAGAAENIQNLVPTGKIAGRAIKALTKGKGQSELGGLLNIDAYHGTPNKLIGDKFDSSKIGTGEGSQAQGYGIYLAENPAVSRQYAGLSNRPGMRQGTSFANSQSKLDAMIALNAKKFTGGDVKQLADVVAKHPSAFAEPEKMLSRMSEYVDNKAPEYLYKVDLPDEKVAQMLDWDKPLSEQSDAVKNAIRNINETDGWLKLVDAQMGGPVMEQATGRDFYKAIGSAPDASRLLSSLGVPGIRYKDAMSRGEGGGTSNFVVFPGDAEKLRILERNGQALGIQGGLLDSTTDSSLLNRYQAPQDEALALAQKRAALPVSEGGLGLPPDNTPMDRAGILFPKKGFHATGSDIRNIDPARVAESDYGTIGQGFYIDPSPTAGYSNLVARINQAKAPQNIMPVRYRDDNLFDMTGMLGPDSPSASKSLTERISDMGYQGTMSSVDGLPNEVAVFDPKIVRSEFAAFDPFRRNEADLLALQGGQYTHQDLLGFERMMGLLGE